MTYAVEVENLTKKIGEVTILNHISMRVKTGEIYGFLGANGAGKTSLMKALYQMMIPDSGSVTLLGELVTPGHCRVFSRIGSVIETPVFYGNFSAGKNLALHAEYMGAGHGQIDEALKLFGLTDAGDKPVKTFSLGMKQRLALARATLTRPELLILDEPMNGLDPQGISTMRELLVDINQKHNTTILISSHILSELEKVVHTIGVIDKGNILDEVSISKLRDRGLDLEAYYLDLLKGAIHDEETDTIRA